MLWSSLLAPLAKKQNSPSSLSPPATIGNNGVIFLLHFFPEGFSSPRFSVLSGLATSLHFLSHFAKWTDLMVHLMTFLLHVIASTEREVCVWSEAISFIETHTSNRGLLHSTSHSIAGVRNDGKVMWGLLHATLHSIAGTRDDSFILRHCEHRARGLCVERSNLVY